MMMTIMHGLVLEKRCKFCSFVVITVLSPNCSLQRFTRADVAFLGADYVIFEMSNKNNNVMCCKIGMSICVLCLGFNGGNH